jgi:hypothetical protein
LFYNKTCLRSEYYACLCEVWILTELIRSLSAVQLELLPDKRARDRQFRLVFCCTVVLCAYVYNVVLR